MHPTLDGGRRMLQKQLARSRVAMQGESAGDEWGSKQDPTSRRVGRRNLGGGEGQFSLRARMLIMRAALVELFILMKTSALGNPWCNATRPAESRESKHGLDQGAVGGL